MEDITIPDIEITKANGNFKEMFNDVLRSFKRNYETSSINFAKECYAHYRLYKLFEDYKKKYGLYYIDGWINREHYSYTYNDILKAFNIKKRTAERLVQCFNKFVDKRVDVDAKIIDVFFPFSKSKLVEMLPLSEEILINQIQSGNIKPSMTAREIREIIKELSGKSKTNKVIEDLDTEEYNEDETYSFDINKLDYDFSYFENQTKDSLLNIVVQLYAYRQKHK